MKSLKKSISILLALLMTLSMFGVVASAVEIPEGYTPLPLSAEGLANGALYFNYDYGFDAAFYKADGNGISDIMFVLEEHNYSVNYSRDSEDASEVEQFEGLKLHLYRVGSALPLAVTEQGYTELPLSAEGLANGALWMSVPSYYPEGYFLAAAYKRDGEGAISSLAIVSSGGTSIYNRDDEYNADAFTSYYEWIYAKGADLPLVYADAGYQVLPFSANGLAEGAYYLDMEAAAAMMAYGATEEQIQTYIASAKAYYRIVNGELDVLVFVGSSLVNELGMMFIHQVGEDLDAIYAVDGYVPMVVGKEKANDNEYYFDIEGFSDWAYEELIAEGSPEGVPEGYELPTKDEFRAMLNAELANGSFYYNAATKKVVLAINALYSEELDLTDEDYAGYETFFGLKVPTAAGSDETVIVIAEADVIPENAVLSVTKADEAKETEIIAQVDMKELAKENEELKEKKIDKIVAYDVSLLVEEQKVQPNTSEGKALTIKVPVPEGFDSAKIVVLHVKDDGTVEQVNATVANGMIVIDAMSLSYYVVAETAEADAEEPATEPAEDKEPQGKAALFTKLMEMFKNLIKIFVDFFKMFKK